MAPLTMAQGNARGLLAPGNIDLAKRPVVKNADGTISTVRSMSFGEDGREVLIPTVSPDGRILSDDDTINLYHQTGQHLGMFDNPQDATTYAQALHNQQDAMYATPAPQSPPPSQQPSQQPHNGPVTLEIEGREVEVDPAFLQLSPEDQERTVSDIAKELGVHPEQRQQQAAPSKDQQQPAPDAPGQPPRAPRHLSFEEGQAMLDAESGTGQAMAGATGYLNGTPVLGPALTSLSEKASAGLSMGLYGGTYDDHLKSIQMRSQALQQANPGTYMGGQIAGAVVPMVAAGSTATGARLLGMRAAALNGVPAASFGARALGLAGRVGMGATSNAVISGADTAARGGSAADVVGSAETSGLIGGAFPIAGAAIRAGAGFVGDRLAPLVNSIVNPEREAARRVGAAVTRDAASTPGGVMTAADEAVAQQAGIPVANVDRGGEVTRALARSAANQSPEARATLDNLASDRFRAQSERATGFLRKVMGGNVDDIAHQENIRAAAARANAPAYHAAYRTPEAQQVYTPRIQQLMQSPSFRRAVDLVPRKSADRGAIAGQKALGNPFMQNSQGAYVLRRAADGTQVTPTLEFWDHVQRNLRPMADRAARAGDRTTAAEIAALRRALNTELDGLVPAFKQARQGAAGFFNAEDALEAGRNFANSPKSIPEARKAFARFTPADRDAFSTGYASELIDRIKASPDRSNVINSVFGNQASRESVELALGPQRAREVEAYVRVEGLVDRLRGAMGNSTTARQLAEMGLGATGGYYATGDWTGATVGALAMGGGRMLAQRAQGDVMKRMAQMLTSDNPAHVKAAVQIAARSPLYMEALARLEKLVAAPARGLSISAGRN